MTILTIPGLMPPPTCMPEIGKLASLKISKGINGVKSREKRLMAQQRMGETAWQNIQRENEPLTLDKETEFTFAYKPYVIAELAWDYADTIAKLSANLKFGQEAKRLSREIYRLRQEYNSYRAPDIDKERQDSEVENMYIFEDCTQDITDKLLTNLRCCLCDFDKASALYLMAVWQCEIMLRALFRYCRRIADKIAAKTNREIPDPLPVQVSSLLTIVTACQKVVPDAPDIEGIKKQYIEVYASQIALAGLNELP